MSTRVRITLAPARSRTTRSCSDSSQLNVASGKPPPAVPTELHALRKPPASTSLLISCRWVALPRLWPGSITTRCPRSEPCGTVREGAVGGGGAERWRGRVGALLGTAAVVGAVVLLRSSTGGAVVTEIEGRDDEETCDLAAVDLSLRGLQPTPMHRHAALRTATERRTRRRRGPTVPVRSLACASRWCRLTALTRSAPDPGRHGPQSTRRTAANGSESRGRRSVMSPPSRAPTCWPQRRRATRAHREARPHADQPFERWLRLAMSPFDVTEPNQPGSGPAGGGHGLDEGGGLGPAPMGNAAATSAAYEAWWSGGT